MSHVAKSKILEEIIVQLRKTGLEIPANVMSDLKAARTLMIVEKADAKNRGDPQPRIDQYIGSVEAYIISEAEKRFPPEQIERWLTALDLASCDTCVTINSPKKDMRMIPGVPRDQKYLRVEPIAAFPIEKLEQMASETNLSFRRDEDGHLIVFGADKDIKDFIKKMTRPSGKP
jgi:hypothetical protein